MLIYVCIHWIWKRLVQTLELFILMANVLHFCKFNIHWFFFTNLVNTVEFFATIITINYCNIDIMA